MNSSTILQKLVSFDTTSALSNLALIDWIETYLSSHGITSQRLLSEDGQKANLLATIGPLKPGGVVLSGHTDVVPVAGQTWSSDPFCVHEREDLFFGRGTCDMKGFIACILAAVPKMEQIKRPIHLALSYDEEVGCRGVAPMIETMVADLPPISAVIVGEPTSMQLITGHKGIFAAQTSIHATPAHSSQTQLGASAVHIASDLITRLITIASELREARHQNSDYDPPYTTLTVNQIEGGTALNILAEHCRFCWDIRSIDPDHVQRIMKDMSAAVDDICANNALVQSIETEILAQAPGLVARQNNAAEDLVKRLSGANSVGAVAFATEAGQFQMAGYDTVVFGPGDIAQAHQPNEFISRHQLEACDQFLDKLIAELTA